MGRKPNEFPAHILSCYDVLKLECVEKNGKKAFFHK